MYYPVLFFLCCVTIPLAYGDQYTSEYDNVDLDQILNNERLLTNYVKCLLDQGKCTPDAVTLKKLIPDALSNDCAKCSETQKKGIEKVMRFIVNKKPDIWKQVADKYDTDGKYREKYEDRLKGFQE